MSWTGHCPDEAGLDAGQVFGRFQISDWNLESLPFGRELHFVSEFQWLQAIKFRRLI